MGERNLVHLNKKLITLQANNWPLFCCILGLKEIIFSPNSNLESQYFKNYNQLDANFSEIFGQGPTSYLVSLEHKLQ